MALGLSSTKENRQSQPAVLNRLDNLLLATSLSHIHMTTSSSSLIFRSTSTVRTSTAIRLISYGQLLFSQIDIKDDAKEVSISWVSATATRHLIAYSAIWGLLSPLSKYWYIWALAFKWYMILLSNRSVATDSGADFMAISNSCCN